MVMVFAAGAVMFAAVVLLRGNFSVGTSTMGTHYEKPPPWELSLWASSVGTLHEKPSMRNSSMDPLWEAASRATFSDVSLTARRNISQRIILRA